jgi:hypothetical protein
MPSLRKLSLEKCKISDDVLRPLLEALAQHQLIQILNLAECGLTCKSMPLIAEVINKSA